MARLLIKQMMFNPPLVRSAPSEDVHGIITRTMLVVDVVVSVPEASERNFSSWQAKSSR